MTTAEPRIEAAARALACHPDGGNITPGSSRLVDKVIEEWMDLARAALLAADAASPASGGEWRPIETVKHRLKDIVFFVTKTLPVEGHPAEQYCEELKKFVLRAAEEAQVALASPSPSVTEEEIIPAMRAAGFSSKEIRAVTYTSWKDGIDIERPSTALVKFVAIIRGERHG